MYRTLTNLKKPPLKLKKIELSQSSPKRRGNHGTYSPKQRYEISKYAAENNPTAAARKLSPLFERKLNENTVRGFRKDYFNHVKSAVRRKSIDPDIEIESEILPPPPKKIRGKKTVTWQ